MNQELSLEEQLRQLEKADLRPAKKPDRCREELLSAEQVKDRYVAFSNRLVLAELDSLRKELEMARQLQATVLPLRRPMFPGREDMEMSAIMEPAADAGGNLFDALFVDQNRMFICIGDVSGHGITEARLSSSEESSEDRLRMIVQEGQDLMAEAVCGEPRKFAGRKVVDDDYRLLLARAGIAIPSGRIQEAMH